MKYFKVLNLNRQHVGPFVATEQWLKEVERTEGAISAYKNMGECDANGNILAEISKDNFTESKTEIPLIFKENGQRETRSGNGEAAEIGDKAKKGNTAGRPKQGTKQAD